MIKTPHPKKKIQTKRNEKIRLTTQLKGNQHLISARATKNQHIRIDIVKYMLKTEKQTKKTK